MLSLLREFSSLADPPEGVQLQVSEDTVCKGANVIFNCSAADAKPMELTYHLYENNVIVSNSSSTGIWNKTMTTAGVIKYSCKVTNIIGTAMSTNVSATINGKHGTFFNYQQKNIRKQVSLHEETYTLFCTVFLCRKVNLINSHNDTHNDTRPY